MTRAELQAQQQQLLEALFDDESTEGPERLEALREVLSLKRLSQVRRVAPSLASHLGADMTARFASYAASQPLPGEGPKEDALRFAARLGPLPDSVVEELLALRVRLRWSRNELPVTAGFLRRRRELVIILGRRWLRFAVPGWKTEFSSEPTPRRRCGAPSGRASASAGRR